MSLTSMSYWRAVDSATKPSELSPTRTASPYVNDLTSLSWCGPGQSQMDALLILEAIVMEEDAQRACLNSPLG
ncbi:unnamed protein product [Parascedosporium putredinis]|uniref:Uncharacterized protein n=1 Tax=Parascedosporium putredinis TaxID=1442378 RepID=A0A9P1M7P1_9PEZI|nr:unnamed protein product [Parascedosporium putredinis]CAI7988384.1 unnamed protein product [Parascedosporium putredinis]